MLPWHTAVGAEALLLEKAFAKPGPQHLGGDTKVVETTPTT